MREIKFRAWDKETKKIYPINTLGMPGATFTHHAEKSVVADEDGNECETTFKSLCDFELMQYTGLKDKNGVEIYEGDVVKHKDIHFPAEVKFGVGTYDSGVYRYQGFFLDAWSEIYGDSGRYEKNGKDTDATGSMLFDCEVIGNIYENPELLAKDTHAK